MSQPWLDTKKVQELAEKMADEMLVRLKMIGSELDPSLSPSGALFEAGAYCVLVHAMEAVKFKDGSRMRDAVLPTFLILFIAGVEEMKKAIPPVLPAEGLH